MLYRLTSILISRFLSDLQAAYRTSTHGSSSDPGNVESLVFGRVVGSVGASLCPEDFAGDDPEDFEDVNNGARRSAMSLAVAEETGDE